MAGSDSPTSKESFQVCNTVYDTQCKTVEDEKCEIRYEDKCEQKYEVSSIITPHHDTIHYNGSQHTFNPHHYLAISHWSMVLTPVVSVRNF